MLRSLVGSEMCIRDSINAEYGGAGVSMPPDSAKDKAALRAKIEKAQLRLKIQQLEAAKRNRTPAEPRPVPTAKPPTTQPPPPQDKHELKRRIEALDNFISQQRKPQQDTQKPNQQDTTTQSNPEPVQGTGRDLEAMPAPVTVAAPTEVDFEKLAFLEGLITKAKAAKAAVIANALKPSSPPEIKASAPKIPEEPKPSGVPSVIQRAIDAETRRVKPKIDSADAPGPNAEPSGGEGANEEPGSLDGDMSPVALAAHQLEEAPLVEMRNRRMRMFLGGAEAVAKVQESPAVTEEVTKDPEPAPVPVAAPVAPKGCLLYTSDAADEEDSVDLGGRRIIKKKIR
eukprot:TRINITY_DN15463_c0_g1_i8.p1 TRINITY_DN15463_c0_g1~~TRINITY_DN15463_c0_g1_i8.p1  ORF type:complete len:341 (-),score=97.67 TRINITY_DN15463_c0_g1_i8:68-1090(-)